MQNCGAPQALTYARGIDGTIFALGAGFGVLGLFFAIFVTYVTYSYIMVAAAAFMNAIMALFAAGPAMIAGRTRHRARRRLEQFFRHAFLVFVYVLYISCAAIIILKTVTPGGYAAQVGMTHPVAQLVLVAVICAVATGLFWWLKRELLHDNTTQHVIHTFGAAIQHGRTGYARANTPTPAAAAAASPTVPETGSPPNTPMANTSSAAITSPVPTLLSPADDPAPSPPTAHPHTVAHPGHRDPETPRPVSVSAGVPAARAAANTAGFGAGEGAAVTGAAEAGAAILAPEVVIPAAVAVAASRTPSTPPATGPRTTHTPTPRRDGGTPPIAGEWGPTWCRDTRTCVRHIGYGARSPIGEPTPTRMMLKRLR